MSKYEHSGKISVKKLFEIELHLIEIIMFGSRAGCISRIIRVISLFGEAQTQQTKEGQYMRHNMRTDTNTHLRRVYYRKDTGWISLKCPREKALHIIVIKISDCRYLGIRVFGYATRVVAKAC